MKKILVFGMTGTIGGIETFLMTYYRNLDKTKYQFDFATVFNSMAFADEVKQMGGRIYKLTDFKKNPFKYKKEIEKLIKKNNYETIYVNMLSAANIIPLKVSKKLGVKNIIAHSHNSNTPNNFIKKLLHYVNKRKIKSLATKLIACSKQAGDWMFGKEQYDVLNNAININKFAYKKEYSQEFKHDADKYIVGHIGRYSEQKNHEFIINIAEKIARINLDIIFVLVGEGEGKEKIFNLIKEKKLTNIIMLDSRKDIYKLYNSFNMFILPSKFEGLPIVGLEAQANGLPCLFSDKITKELKINNNVEFLSINDSDSNLWVTKINEMPIRTNKIYLKEHGYDINSNIIKFEEIIK